jgi:hypothetical protein
VGTVACSPCGVAEALDLAPVDMPEKGLKPVSTMNDARHWSDEGNESLSSYRIGYKQCASCFGLDDLRIHIWPM